MIWGVISCYGTSHLVRVEGKMDSKQYRSVLEADLLPFAAETFGEEWSFQQYGASCHRSNYTRNWLLLKNMKLLDCPAKYTDLNKIENAWGLLARRFYGNRRQFDSPEDLADKSIDFWDSITPQYLNKLY